MKSLKRHYILFLTTLAIAVVCGIMMPHVRINSDMTLYLPDHSPMKQGLSILNSEFDASAMSIADVKVMYKHLTQEERTEIMHSLEGFDDVQSLSLRLSEDSVYTLYSLVISKSVDQKALGQQIYEQLGHEPIVETSQDGATPPISALIIAAVLILAILLLMTQSWLDPLLILIAAGVAVVINVGSNVLLPSVSITTNYIVAILQLVLSLDYSIILLNRWRQESQLGRPVIEAVNMALKSAYKPILSSALTTVVGLLMLAFMRLKIGMDMGTVLAKGVLCSLICTFTILPTLILWMHRAIHACHKRTYVLPMDRLGRFATGHKITIAITAAVLFVGSYVLSRQTTISFSTNGERQIQKIFPSHNPMLLVYNPKEEQQVIALADSLQQDSNVVSLFAYPTLLCRQYTAEQLATYIADMSDNMTEFLPQDLPQDISLESITSPQLLRTAYYLHSGAGDELTIGFMELMNFIKDSCISNPLFADMISDDMRRQLAMLDILRDNENENLNDNLNNKRNSEPITAIREPLLPDSLSVNEEQDIQIDKPSIHIEEQEPRTADSIPIGWFLDKLYAMSPNDLTAELRRLSDTTLLRSEMDQQQMSDYIGSSPAQTKIVFNLAKGNVKHMTPVAYTHLLTDDLFHRKMFAGFVSQSQKQALNSRRRLMDTAVYQDSVSAATLSTLLTDIGLPLTEEQVLAVAYPQAQHGDSTLSDVDSIVPVVIAPAPVIKRKTKAEQQAEYALHLIQSDQRYTYRQMTQNFNRLGESIDEGMVRMLYAYYGTLCCYDTTLHLSPEQFLAYMADTLVNLPTARLFLDSTSAVMIQNAKAQVQTFISMLSKDNHALMVVLTSLPDESSDTYTFVEQLQQWSDELLHLPHYLIGESVMFTEMRDGFDEEMTRVTLLTILAIFLIVAISFRSLIIPTLLVMTVMTAVFVNVIYAGIHPGHMLHLAYLISQSILMGATIDYGILYTNYYKEHRKHCDRYESAKAAYQGSIRTIMTSGLIMVLGPGVMSILVDDVAISAIVGSISVGALMSVLLILIVLPGMLVAFDKWIVGWWKGVQQ